MPHAPQLRASVCRLLQVPAVHEVKPASQVHALDAQLAPVPHCVPQAPQSKLLVVKSTHALEQLVSVAAQVVVHAESEHTCIAAQTVVQLPQCFGSLVTSVHTPLQRIEPAAQPHTPAVHEVPPRQTMPQPPQLA